MDRELRAFTTIADCGSFSAAADRAGMTQAGLSKSIARLEADLGVSLFRRLPKGIELTAEGQKVYARAKVIEAELRYLRLETDTARTERAQVLKVGMSPLWSVLHLSQLVAGMRRLHPRTALQISVHRKELLIPRLEQGLLDFAICDTEGPDGDDRIVREPMRAVDILIACARDHPLRAVWNGDPQTLSGWDWVIYQPLDDDRAAVNRNFEALGLPPPASFVQTGSWLSGLMLASQGGYLMNAPRLLGPFIARFGVFLLDGAPVVQQFEGGLWARRSVLETGIGRTFRALVREHIRDAAPTPPDRK